MNRGSETQLQVAQNLDFLAQCSKDKMQSTFITKYSQNGHFTMRSFKTMHLQKTIRGFISVYGTDIINVIKSRLTESWGYLDFLAVRPEITSFTTVEKNTHDTLYSLYN